MQKKARGEGGDKTRGRGRREEDRGQKMHQILELSSGVIVAGLDPRLSMEERQGKERQTAGNAQSGWLQKCRLEAARIPPSLCCGLRDPSLSVARRSCSTVMAFTWKVRM